MALAIGIGSARPERLRRASCAPVERPASVEGSAPGIAEIQRARVLAATLEVVARRGAAGATVAHVVQCAGVSRRTFYESFDDLEECLLAAFEDALQRAHELVLPAYAEQATWSERLRASLIALLCFLEQEPNAGRFLLIESLAGGERVLARREQVLAELVAVVEEGRNQSKSGMHTPPPLTGEGVVGGVLSILARLIAHPDQESLVGMTGELMGLIVMPYQGGAAAHREMDRPVEPPPSRGLAAAKTFSDPFKPAGLRLTYRTARVLLAIAEHPDASNRQIGELAEMRDQGQVSKLLGRLRRLELIENTGLTAGQGAPNSWRLTDKGVQMQQSIKAYTGAKSNIDTTLGTREGTPK